MGDEEEEEEEIKLDGNNLPLLFLSLKLSALVKCSSTTAATSPE
jgi:hypothetical protein